MSEFTSLRLLRADEPGGPESEDRTNRPLLALRGSRCALAARVGLELE